jgi:hypothetical protein
MKLELGRTEWVKESWRPTFDDERRRSFFVRKERLVCGRVVFFPDHTMGRTRFMSLYYSKACKWVDHALPLVPKKQNECENENESIW